MVNLDGERPWYAKGLIVLGLLLPAVLCIPRNMDLRNSVDGASGNSECLTILLHLAIGFPTTESYRCVVALGDNKLGMQGARMLFRSIFNDLRSRLPARDRVGKDTTPAI